MKGKHMINVDVTLIARYGIVQKPRSAEESITVQETGTLAVGEGLEVIEFAEFVVAERFGADSN
jgi:hypothetical protein